MIVIIFPKIFSIKKKDNKTIKKNVSSAIKINNKKTSLNSGNKIRKKI